MGVALMGRIEWCERSWNPIRGCTRISPGCGGPGPHGGCYAEAIAARFSDAGQPFHGFAERTRSGPRWTGRVELIEDRLLLPLQWRTPARIFVNSASDVFHDAVTDEMLDRIFAVMACCPQHTFMVLTKRAARMRGYASMFETPGRAGRVLHSIAATSKHKNAFSLWRAQDRLIDWPLPNLMLGVSVEDQPRADERIPPLLDTPAAVRFISYEPALGRVGFDLTGINWMVCGAESGPHARPCDLDWIRSARDQCVSAGTAFFFKQTALNGRKISLPELDGRQWAQFPEATHG
jgi:protein gp37